MGEHARITSGGRIVIDTTAWISRRTSRPRPDLTADLHAWAHQGTDLQPVPDSNTGWPDAAQAWCAARGHHVREPGLIVHEQSRLDARVWVLTATTTDGDPVAVVAVNDHPPTVYADGTSDPWAWCDAESVVIACPGGHTWTLRSGREVLTAAGRPATLTTVFGVNLDAPFSTCPTCTQFHLGAQATPCGCDGSPWIVCPVCGLRCDVHLPTP
jgi:hypothetical protein